MFELKSMALILNFPPRSGWVGGWVGGFQPLSTQGTGVFSPIVKDGTGTESHPEIYIHIYYYIGILFRSISRHVIYITS